MKVIPILFGTEMVQAILKGRKLQTRRVVKHQSDANCFSAGHDWEMSDMLKRCPYGNVGDILYVRETWTRSLGYMYKADAPDVDTDEKVKWRPSIHMPKRASRIFLLVEAVEVERLQDITGDDAIAEGISRYPASPIDGFKNYQYLDQFCINPDESFESLWRSIYGPESWEQNPWVWVIKFRPIRPFGQRLPNDDIFSTQYHKEQ
jgi:hypothetical protein